jgi:hypothetical protein
MPLGQMLVNNGILSEAQLTEALSRQRKTRDRLGHILIEMKLIDEQVLLKYLGAQFRKEAITHQELQSLDLDVVRLVPEEVARQYRIIAAERHGRRLVVATADPLNVVALDDLRRATGLEVDFKIGPGWAIQEAIEKTYRRMVSTEGIDEALRQDLGLSVGTVPAIEELVDIQQLRTQAADPPVVKVVNYVLSRAAADGASDIHVEAYEDRTRVRYRIDGLLFDLLEVPRSLHLAVVSRLKIISRLDIASAGSQDGSFASTSIARSTSRVDPADDHGERSSCASSRRRPSSSTTRSRTSVRARAARGVPARDQAPGDGADRATGSGKSTTLHTAIKAIKSRARTSSRSRIRWSTASRDQQVR